MNKACPNVVNECLPCNDWPVENLSIEAPDDPTYLSLVNWSPPKVGFKAKGCLSWCFSDVSQAAADACAAAQAALCVGDRPGTSFVYSQEQRIGCGQSGGVYLPMTVTGPLPPGYTTDGYSLILPAGSVSVSADAAPDPQEAADSLARDSLRAVFNTLVANGCITCIQWEWITEATSTSPVPPDEFLLNYVAGQTTLKTFWGSPGLLVATPVPVMTHVFGPILGSQRWKGHATVWCPDIPLHWDMIAWNYNTLAEYPPDYILGPSRLTSAEWRLNGTVIPAGALGYYGWLQYVGNGVVTMNSPSVPPVLLTSYRWTTAPYQVFVLEWDMASAGPQGLQTMQFFVCRH